MAEVVGLVAASGQFVEQSIKIVKLTKRLRDKFKDAPKEIEGWCEEIVSLQKVVDKIQTTPALQVDDLKPIIDQCKSVSEELLDIFNDLKFTEEDSFGHKSWRAVVALSKEEEIQGLFNQIERLKSTLDIQLGIIHLNQSHEGIAHITSLLEGMKLSFQPGTDEEKCLQALFVTDPVSDREGLITAKGHRTSGTCEWIPKTQEYQNWNAARDGLLWISGPPGKGKTIMSIFLTQLLEASKPDATVIWFFCDNKAESRNNASNILRGLMTQLILKHNHLIPCLLSTWKIQRDKLFRSDSFETLWRIFVSMLEDLDGQEVCCVLDGLDECVESSLSLLLFKFKTLFQHHTSPGPQPSWKLIIASREQPKVLFESLLTFPRMPLDNLEHDINLYITDRVTHLARVKNIQNSPLQLQIETALRKGAEGTFLWVSFMSQDLENSTVNEIENALAHLPRGLYSIYQRILGQIKPENRDAISEMLTWILFAFYPLRLVELCDAIQIKPTKALTREQVCLGYVQSCGHLLQLQIYDKDGELRTVHVPSLLDYNQELKALTGDDREEYQGALHATFVHQSAKDFLLSTAVDRSILSPAVNDKEGHAIIVNRLITLLSEHLNSANMDEAEIEARVPLLSYAIELWYFYMAELQDECKAVLRKHPAFFGERSITRDRWWRQRHWFVPGSEKLQDVPFLQMACRLGLHHLAEAWLLPRNALLRLRRKRKLNEQWDGGTPLHTAVDHMHKETVRVLLKYGADVTIRNKYSQTPIHLAVKSSAMSEEIFWLLLASKKGNSVLKKEAKCDTEELTRMSSLLHLAAENGSESICQELIEHFHYDVDSKISMDQTPLRSALVKRQKHLANLLVNRWNARLNSHFELFEAVTRCGWDTGDTMEACLQILVQDWGCDINTTDENENAVFQSYSFRFVALQAIQSCGFPISWDHRNVQGKTFLHETVNWVKDARLLCAFLQHSRWGINTRDNQGRTPLHTVIFRVRNYDDWEIKMEGHLIDIRSLLDFGADRSLTDDEGASASDMAIYLLNSPPRGTLHTRVTDWAKQTIELLDNYTTVSTNPREVDLHLERPDWPSL